MSKQPRTSRLFGISAKMTVTSVLLVLLVVGVFAFLTANSISEEVEQETERLVKLRTEAIDEIGTSTARILSLPSASPMYDNDLQSLYGLVRPVVEARSGNSAVYAYIFATNERVWIGVLSEEYDALYLDDQGPFMQKVAGQDQVVVQEQIDAALVAPYQAASSFPVREDVTRALSREGEQVELELQQYTSPIVARNGEVLGFLTIAYSLDALRQEVETLRSQGEARKESSRQHIMLLGALAILLGIVIGVLQSLAITRNVKVLSKVATQIASGDLSVRAQVRSRDEIGSLGNKFNQMADRVEALLIETQEKAKLEKELDIARMIQETLVPQPGLHTEAGLAMIGYFESASICGGDFWYRNQVKNGEMLVCIGDVTGHGVPSAMISAAAKSGLDTLVNLSQGGMALDRLLAELNKTIFDTAKRTLFMTFLALQFDLRTRRLAIANAGHNFALQIRGSAPNAIVRPLVARGNRLGDERQSLYQQVEADLLPGDLIFLYTDGITEYADAQGKEYGERRLRKLLQASAGMGPEALLNATLQDLQAFHQGAPQEDDVTIVVVQVLG